MCPLFVINITIPKRDSCALLESNDLPRIARQVLANLQAREHGESTHIPGHIECSC
jgi:hypothetical protein